MSHFQSWSGQLLSFLELDDTAELAQEWTLVVNEVICTLVHPVGRGEQFAALLLDAGHLELPADADYLMQALGRNVENFLNGAPVFIFNTDTMHLLIAQEFQFDEFSPSVFASLLDSLTWQARAWHKAR
ncbi:MULTISPECIES: hypothetical protein [unclassified Undibacterium]|uniref:hypothetical protein n=1 Tax=unclassified Undibacterium TaxID=2630295 RepID=UPI002AC8C712|nr:MULTISPECIES: hypothetical protein [unclassified Undibacterium]MEB0138809.1 hypothetical protein [Undibacterium sp. CCC2.1]MEB0170715.1 hypothetical protein [Undibacterium sp. CCC1.1]MEB0174604.1 hypothetical protein [Undibacterium sp. CCC3.4]MEB0213801.1 hypothetical protein [Undibacterium sp. 5I2]WPX42529.1 hypothetical protein RHM61_14175 [Undibacterium sp. CCC3.4]